MRKRQWVTAWAINDLLSPMTAEGFNKIFRPSAKRQRFASMLRKLGRGAEWSNRIDTGKSTDFNHNMHARAFSFPVVYQVRRPQHLRCFADKSDWQRGFHRTSRSRRGQFTHRARALTSAAQNRAILVKSSTVRREAKVFLMNPSGRRRAGRTGSCNSNSSKTLSDNGRGH